MFLRSILTAATLSTSIAMACEPTPRQFQNEALLFLQKEFPRQTFSLGKTVDVIVMGEVEFGLQNLRSKICLASPSMSPSARQEQMRIHFQAMMVRLQERQPAMPGAWSEVKGNLLLQLMPAEYSRAIGKERPVITRPFAPGVELGVVLDGKDSYEYVREEDRTRWAISQQELFDAAAANLAKKRAGVRLQGSDDATSRFLALEEKDGFDAVSVLIPSVRQEAAKVFGNPFLVAIPNRDFLIMWSAKQGTSFQSRVRSKVQQDFRSRPYPLLAVVLQVWSDGRIEVAP